MSTKTWSGAGRTFETCVDMDRLDVELAVHLLLSLLDRHPLQILRADVIGARTDDLAVDALFDDVCRPARGAAHHENRREHLGWDSHHVIARRAVPVEIGKHFL